MTLDAETAGIDNLTALAEYIDHFNVHYRLLLRRYKRFQEIDDIYNTDIDVITYLDMIVVQLRAMCIESPHLKSNYTAQILLRKLGESELADRLDKMLEEPFIEVTDFTIRKALKTLADCFICHYDRSKISRNYWLFEPKCRNNAEITYTQRLQIASYFP